MRSLWKRATLVALIFAVVCTMGGCKKKTKKPAKTTDGPTVSQDVTSDVSSEETEKPVVHAEGKGNNKSDVPLVVGCKKLEKKFNPFSAKSEQDQKAISLTQLHLVTFDREGALVENAIDGEERSYNGENYTYTGPADIKVKYSKKNNESRYIIRLREDMTFSDGKPVMADDILFTMYALADASYEGNLKFADMDIKGLQAYRSENGKAANISGIEKINDYKMRITVKGYDREDIHRLNIPICPLHYYGSVDSFDAENHKFGFNKGDISTLIEKKDHPIGGGAYRFIKYESGVVYYEANEKYYQGCPDIAYIQMKEMESQTAEKLVEQLANGDVDVLTLPGTTEAVEQIVSWNSNGKTTGKTITSVFSDGDCYTYVGMNAETICVDGKADSTRSKHLRHALAILFACNRGSWINVMEQGASLINYPASETSWSVPQIKDEEYVNAYVDDTEGLTIYNSNMDIIERTKAAKKAALQYLKLAGYKVKKGKVVKAADGASRRFQILIPSDAGSDGLKSLAVNVRQLFKDIGLKLELNYKYTQAEMEKLQKKNKHEIWCAYEQTSVQGALYEMYHSKGTGGKAGIRNHFNISDSDLDEDIEDSMITPGLKKSIKLYNRCYEKIMEWSVEVPLYQERDITIFRTSNVNMESVATDTTRYYSWEQEIQNMEMK